MAVQLFNKIKKKKKEDKEHEKTCFAVFHRRYVKIIIFIFGEFILFCMF